MLKTIILLTGPHEQPVLMARLVELNPDLAIAPLTTADDLAAVGDAVLADARLIGFATPVIVPRKVLQALGHGAYNFHPGPPAYPGLCPAQLAVYEGATSFGATAHRMVERVDAGPIVAFERFSVPAGSSVHDFEGKAYTALARLFWELAPALATCNEPLAELDEPWGQVKSSRRMLEAICAIQPDIDPTELDRRIFAFGNSPFGVAPTVTLHGRRFRLVPD